MIEYFKIKTIKINQILCWRCCWILVLKRELSPY